MKHHDRNFKNILSKQDIANDRFIKLITAVILIMAILMVLISCNSVMNATSASGKALETRGNYAYIRLDAERGKADYNTFLEIYFPYKIKKGERVYVVTQSYLDSLKTSRQ